MTELIVALDGPNPRSLAHMLHVEAGVRWFKLGPQILSSSQFHELLYLPRSDKIFFDLKLVDTADTCLETAKRFADAGVAAVSTFSNRATEAVMRGAEGSSLKVWRVVRLTDSPGIAGVELMNRQGTLVLGHGVICPVQDLVGRQGLPRHPHVTS